MEVYPQNTYYLFTFNEPIENVKGIKIFNLTPVKYFKKFRYLLRISEFRKSVSKLNPDILIAYRINSYGLMAVRSRISPIVVIAQGSDIFYLRLADRVLQMPKIIHH